MTQGLAGQAPDWRQALAVVLFALLVAASGLFVAPPLDRDESRFVQATTQMIESGDYVRIRYQELERNKKPVGIHWLQAASVQALGGAEDRAVWKYRLPSLLGAAGAALATYLIGCLLFGRRAALAAVLLLASAPVVAAEGSIAKTDAALLASVVAAQLGLARAYAGRRGPGTWLTFWLALAAGILVKGPIAPMIAGLTALALVLAERRARWLLALRPLPGAFLAALVVSPWYVAIGVVTDWRFYAEAVGTDMLGKVGEAQESHSGPFGYHAALVWALFWPAALLLPAALRWALPRWRSPAPLFCLAWVLPSWLVFEAAGTKLPHYAMPLYPALALLIGGFAVSEDAERFAAWRWAGIAVFALVGLAASGAVLFLLLTHHEGGLGPVALILPFAALPLAVYAARHAARGRIPRAAQAAAVSSAVLAWVVFQFALPRLDELAVTPRLADALHEAGVHPRLDDAPPVALTGYHEPSAVFLLGTDTLLTDAAGAARYLAAAPGRTAAVESRDYAAFLEALGAVRVRPLATVEGLNYSDGDEVSLTLVRSL